MKAPLHLVWFAGGGGSSQGARQALGRDPDYALNHDAVALRMHEVNHPDTVHMCADGYAASPLELEPGRPIATMWFSPDCTHHSKARGSAPKSKRIRGLAWCVIPWAKLRRPDVIFIENVEEFRDWSPLYPPGHPRAGQTDPARKGETFRLFNRRMAQCGYVGEWRELVIADYGGETTRKRLFGIFRSDGQPISWPERTHAPLHLADKLGLKPWVGAASFIDFDRPCPSIFLTQAEAKALKLKVKRPLVAATKRRIAQGIKRYVIEAARPFIVPITHHGADRVHSVDDPLRTVTAAHRGEFALGAAEMQASPYLFGCGGRRGQSPAIPADRPVDRPLRTVTSNRHDSLIAASLTSYYATGVGSDLADPIRTVTGEDRHGLVTAFMEQANTGMVGHAIEEPVSTIVGRGTTQRLVQSRLREISAVSGSRRAKVLEFLWEHFGEPTEDEWADPLGTTQARLRFGLVLIEGSVWEIADIGMRMLTVRELFRAQTFPADYIIDRDIKGRPITGTAATLMCGNAVPPLIAERLYACNWPGEVPEERFAA